MKYKYLTPPTIKDWVQIGNFLREEGHQNGFDVLAEWMKLPKKFREANTEIERMIRQEMKRS